MKKPPSAAELARQLGVTGKTAWLLRRKITHAMRRGEHELLLRGVVELDESLVGGRDRGSGKRGRTSRRKTLVAVSAEQTPRGGLGRAHLRVIDNVSAKTLTNAAGAMIEPGSTVKTDGWRAYRALTGAGYLHLSLIHISEPTRLGMISYAVFCLKKKKKEKNRKAE